MTPTLLDARRSKLRAPSRSGLPWQIVATRQVYFGHQSVGSQVVAAVEQLSRENALGLRFVKTDDPTAVRSPAFVHFDAGTNERPATKNQALLAVLDRRDAADGAVVILKYCYVDVNGRTDIDTMFEGYRALVATIRSRHPDTKLVHCTIPLTVVESPLKAAAKRTIGRLTARDSAIARHRYNALIRSTFAEEPLFDIACVEATTEGAREVNFSHGGELIPVLAPENASDAGHLNPRAARVAAGALLDVLTRAITGVGSGALTTSRCMPNGRSNLR